MSSGRLRGQCGHEHDTDAALGHDRARHRRQPGLRQGHRGGAGRGGARVAGLLLDQHRPRPLVLNAGAAPLLRPLHRQTWQTFSRNWDVDVQHVFNWTREALLLPLAPGSVVIAFSSGVALAGSPMSGGYAGAKGTIRFIAAYGAAESARAGLGIRAVPA